jgi:hypothetical protein
LAKLFTDLGMLVFRVVHQESLLGAPLEPNRARASYAFERRPTDGEASEH